MGSPVPRVVQSVFVHTHTAAHPREGDQGLAVASACLCCQALTTHSRTREANYLDTIDCKL